MAEQLQLFYEKDVNPIREKVLEALEIDFQVHKWTLKEAFISSFKKTCEEIKKLEETQEFKVGFLMYNLLRTQVMQHQYNYRIYVYDENWYLKDGIYIGELDVSFIYKYYEEMWQELLKCSKKYVLKIGVLDVEHIMLEQLQYFHKYVVGLMQFSLLDALEIEEYIALNKADVFQIQTGEFFEPCDPIHIEAQEKDSFQLKKFIEKNEKGAYYFQDFRGLEMDELMCNGSDLRYADFRESQLNRSSMMCSLLIGTKFKGCQMKEANLSVSMICEANFENADLSNANFQQAVAFVGKNEANAWKQVGFTPTSFKNSNLTQANFQGATLSSVDFTGANLTHTNFQDATLYGSQFTRTQLKMCEFSQKQLEQLKIVE